MKRMAVHWRAKELLQETSCAVVRGSKNHKNRLGDDHNKSRAKKRAWLTHFSLEPMLSECACVHVWVQAGGGLQQVCKRKVLAPMQRRCGGNAERYSSSSSSLHHQRWSDWTLPDLCVVSLCLREHTWRVTEPPPQTRKPQIHSSSAPCLWMFISRRYVSPFALKLEA